MEGLLYKILNMWKKNFSFFLVFIALLIFEIPYITSVEGTDNTAWYEHINYFFVILWAIPAFVVLSYILFMRWHIPKAKKNTHGIVFYVVNANEKQYEAISKKFITQFEKAVNSESQEYSVVVMDDYHSNKYYSLLNKHTDDNGRKKQVNHLKKIRCCVAILIECVNGGDGEELFCHMNTNVAIAHKALPAKVKEFLVNDISRAFSPLQDVDIMKLTETLDLSQHTISMEIICKYILASTCFHCGDFLGAIRLLETIDSNLSTRSNLPEAIMPIKGVLSNRLAVSYRVLAEYEYDRYCRDHDDKYLAAVRKAISNIHCKNAYNDDNDYKVLVGICSFVLDKNIEFALHCMDLCDKKDPVIKYNKVFLLMYKNCSVNNIFRTYNLYKRFGLLTNNVQDQIEAFTYHEYEKDMSKKQLLFILFFIYDYQGNKVLAKRCLDQFCAAFPWVSKSKSSSVLKKLNKKYSEVKYDEGEMYSI